MAWSDRPWILDGANVRVSIIGLDDGSQTERTLDGRPVAVIHANLTSEAETTSAQTLTENSGICFMGTSERALSTLLQNCTAMLAPPPEPEWKTESDVVRPWLHAVISHADP